MTNTQHMQPRLDYAKAAPGANAAMYTVERYVRECGLERGPLELVKLRASQINGCAYCVDMHTKDARANGETEQRLYAVVVWREAPFFTERERIALAWTEAVTLVSQEQVPDSVFEIARKEFSDKRTGRSNHGGNRHQRMEPSGHQFSCGSWDLSARAATGRRQGGVKCSL